MGLINAIYSYGPDVAISFTSDRAMMPDPANYAQALRDSFAELLAAGDQVPVKAKPEDVATVKAAPKAKAAPVKKLVAKAAVKVAAKKTTSAKRVATKTKPKTAK